VSVSTRIVSSIVFRPRQSRPPGGGLCAGGGGCIACDRNEEEELRLLFFPVSGLANGSPLRSRPMRPSYVAIFNPAQLFARDPSPRDLAFIS
jgi:hypothetical protein